MTKTELNEKTDFRFNETHDALQAVYDGLNQGQRKKLLKNEKIKELLERYKVIKEEEVNYNE